MRNEATSSALALDRYSYIRGQIGAAAIPDNFIFRGMQGAQLPETPPSPPAMRRERAGEAQPTAATPSADPTAPGLGARERSRPANVPTGDVPVDQRPPPVLTPPPASAPAPVEPAAAGPDPTPAAAVPSAATTSAPAPSAAAPATSGAFAASSTSPTARGNIVQVAAFSEVARGRDLQKQLRSAGFDAYWESVQTAKGEVVRVRVAVDTATQSMADTLAKLKSMGFDPIVVTP